MLYDSHKPIAVFLGPSLERSYACQCVAANYYPPARMGDIYRLLGSGVRKIVLIDGVFHSTASVWQRELLEALDNNIMIIGASSMGALRAVELHPFGMRGYGTIFEWYRTGVIEGDDEVALNHADEAHGFRSFSEPLVNIRYNLMKAVEKKCISPAQATELIEYAKNTFYADRSYEALLSGPVVEQWPQPAQERLAQFIRQEAVNLKQQDAIGALHFCARLANRENRRFPTSNPVKNRGRYYRSVRYRHRGFLHPQGYLVNGDAILAEALKDVALIDVLRPRLIKNHFLMSWAKQRHLTCPLDYFEAYRRAWANASSRPTDSSWLQANGLTEREYQEALVERALLAWLVERGPTACGLDFQPYDQLVMAILSLSLNGENEIVLSEPEETNLDRRASLLRHTSEICYLAAWARDNGIVCPPKYVEKYIENWEETHHISNRAIWLNTGCMPEANYRVALAAWANSQWLIDKGPPHFGYTSWSFEIALLKELQITGQAAQIAEKIVELT